MKESLDTLPNTSSNVEIDGVFSIEGLTNSPDGLRTMGRGATRAALLDEQSRVTFESPEQAVAYRRALENEAKFNNVDAYREVRDQLRQATDPDEIARLTEEEKRQWDEYRSKGQKIGVRNATIRNNILTFDA